MTARRTFLRHLRIARGSGPEQLATRPSGGDGAISRSRQGLSQSPFGAAGGAAAALVAVACAFGQMPDQASLRDTRAGEAGAGTSRSTIDSFLSDSRRFLDL
ncbi:MAG: hypothetical protein IH604_04075 [Burkholderiales bacterium]|nr:hypothetical protein [Burkholderiales bacterium]